VRGFEDRVEVTVEDFGDAFDPAHYTPPRLPGAPGDDAALRERGVGLYLVSQLVDGLKTDPARAKGFAPPPTS
jgi:anti-sigma regulatory factor (Ser/Thr protein kinase)